MKTCDFFQLSNNFEEFTFLRDKFDFFYNDHGNLFHGLISRGSRQAEATRNIVY